MTDRQKAISHLLFALKIANKIQKSKIKIKFLLPISTKNNKRVSRRGKMRKAARIKTAVDSRFLSVKKFFSKK